MAHVLSHVSTLSHLGLPQTTVQAPLSTSELEGAILRIDKGKAHLATHLETPGN